MTVVAVAAHLMQQPLGEGAGLELLAAKYGHDLKSLDQVFWHVLTKLAYYRELTLRVEQLASKGLVDPVLLRVGPHGLDVEEGAGGGRGGSGGGAREGAAGEKKGGGGGGRDAGREEGSGGGGGGQFGGGSGGRAGGGGGGTAAAGAAGGVGEVDSFSQKLAAILNADLTQVGGEGDVGRSFHLKAGSLVDFGQGFHYCSHVVGTVVS